MPCQLTPDQVSSPVPRDIDISQSLEGSLPHIAVLGEACGILESELEPYGRFKAKVSVSSPRVGVLSMYACTEDFAE